MKESTKKLLKDLSLDIHKQWVKHYWNVKGRTQAPKNVRIAVDIANQVIEKHRDKL